MKTFHSASKDTQREIAELLISDNYFSTRHKSSFFEVNDDTQKEIAELALKEDYSLPNFSKSKTIRDFDGLRIKTIQEFLAKQAKQHRDFLSQEDLEFQQLEREVTDEKSLKFMLAKKDVQSFNPQSIKYSKHKSQDMKGFEKDLVKRLRDDEQKYLSSELSNQVQLSRALVDLGSNYQIEL